MGKTKALHSTLFTLVVMAILILLIIIPVSAADDEAAEATNDSLEVANVVSTTTSDQVLPDGVYRIYNYSTYENLQVEGYGIANGTNVCADYSCVYDYSDTMEKNALWLVTCLPNGTYSLRPLHKPNMGLSYSSGNVDIYAIGISATSVAYDARWKIFVDEDNPHGYVVQNQGNSSLTMALNSSTGNVYTSEYSGAPRERWSFDKLTDAEVASLEGIIVYGDSAVKVGSSTQLIAGVFSTETLNQGVTYYSNYSAATTTSAGYLTGVSEGSVVIGVTSNVDASVTGSAMIYVVTKDRQAATLVGIPSSSGGAHDHTSYFSDVTDDIKAIYGSTAGVSTYTSISNGNDAVGYICNSDVFVYRGHGKFNRIIFGDDTMNAPIMSISSFGSGEMRLFSKSDLIIYCCCLCGEGGETGNNLVVATYNRGAKNVIGFKTKINCDEANNWLADFFTSLLEQTSGDKITFTSVLNALRDAERKHFNTSAARLNMLFMYNE